MADTVTAESSLPEVLRFLSRVVSRDVIETVADYNRAKAGFPDDRSLAFALNVDLSVVEQWKRGTSPAIDEKQRLRDLAVAVSELEKVYEPEVIPAWLSARGSGEEKSPLEWLREGNLAEVLHLINASAQGAYS
jgi:hypothetical protein